MQQKKRLSWILSIVLILSLFIPDTVFVYAQDTIDEKSKVIEETNIETETVLDENESTFLRSENEDVVGIIGGYVWADMNENGIKDENEEFLPGTSLLLFLADNRSEPIQEVMSDENGNYQFEGLARGEYCVAVMAQSLRGIQYLIPMTGFQSGLDNKFGADLENEPIRAYSEVIKIEEGEVTDINAGLRIATKVIPASIDLNKKYQIYDGTDTHLESEDTLQSAIDYCNIATGTKFTIVLTKDDEDQGATATLNTGKEIILKSNATGTPYEILIKGVNSRRHLEISNNGSLTLENITLKGEGYEYGGANWSDINGGINVDGGVLRIGNDATITMCRGHEGGGVKATGNSKVYVSGSVDHNQASDSAGGIFSRDSSIEMDGGNVSDNIGHHNSGGVYLDNSTLIMSNGASVARNKPAKDGGNHRAGGIEAQNSTITMNDSGVTGNSVQSTDGTVGLGAGIYSVNTSITMINSEISNNTADQFGGGIYLKGSSVTMKGSSINDNTSTDDGGGIFSIGGDSASSIVLQANGETPSSIHENTTGDNGGGVFLNGGTMEVYDKSRIHANTTATGKDGGGIRATGGAKVTLDTAQIYRNESGNGAGISANDGSKITMNESSIHHNVTEDRGGGVNIDNAEFTMTGGDITENTAKTGGGVVVDKSVFTMTNGTITGNYAGETGGGGFFVEGNKATLVIEDSEVSYNKTTGSGGGIYTRAEAQADGVDYTAITITNSTINDNKTEVHGGGIFASKSICDMQTVEFVRNEAMQYGGGVRAEDSAQISITNDSNVQGNSATDGGGISANKQSGVTLNNTDVIENKAIITEDSATAFGTGGGINIDHQGTTLNMTGGRIDKNEAKSNGGGVYASAGAAFTFNGTQITENKAQYGGGISANGQSTIGMTGVSSVSKNTATYFGGGVNIDKAGTTFTVNDNGIISENIAMEGAGVFASAGAAFVMNHGTVSDNTASSNGGGVYLQADSTINAIAGAIQDNSAKRDGGGIFTANYLYEFNVDLDTYYINVAIDKDNVVMTGNTSQERQTPPISPTGTADFKEEYLNNDDINFFPDSVKLTYYANGGQGTAGDTVEMNYKKGAEVQVEDILNLFTNEGKVIVYWCTDPDGNGQTYRADGTDNFIITEDTVLNAIWRATPAIGGVAFKDVNGDGNFDTNDGDIPIAGCEVILYVWDAIADDWVICEDSDAGASGTVTTDANGEYLFILAVENASYKVKFQTYGDDSGPYGEYGFTKKGDDGFKASTVNVDGYTNEMVVDLGVEQDFFANAGYKVMVQVTGINIDNVVWFIVVAFSGIGLIGLYMKIRRRSRKEHERLR